MVIGSLIFLFPSFVLGDFRNDIWFIWCWGCACAFIGAGYVIWHFRNEFDKW